MHAVDQSRGEQFSRQVACDLTSASLAVEELACFCRSLVTADVEPVVEQIELCTTEALVNVVKHAFTGLTDQIIEMRCTFDGHRFTVEIFDNGIELPSGLLDTGFSHFDITNLDDLPEGGFGWALIGDQMDDVSHTRSAGINHLTMTKQLAT